MSPQPRVILTGLCWTLFFQHSFWTRGPQTTSHMVLLIWISSSEASFPKFIWWCWKPPWSQASTVTPLPVPTGGTSSQKAILSVRPSWISLIFDLPALSHVWSDLKRLHFLHLCRIQDKADCTLFSTSKTGTTLAQSPRPSESLWLFPGVSVHHCQLLGANPIQLYGSVHPAPLSSPWCWLLASIPSCWGTPWTLGQAENVHISVFSSLMPLGCLPWFQTHSAHHGLPQLGTPHVMLPCEPVDPQGWEREAQGREALSLGEGKSLGAEQLPWQLWQLAADLKQTSGKSAEPWAAQRHWHGRAGTHLTV